MPTTKRGDLSSISGIRIVGKPTVSTLAQWHAETTHTYTLTHNTIFLNRGGEEKEESKQLSGLSLCLEVFRLQCPQEAGSQLWLEGRGNIS